MSDTNRDEERDQASIELSEILEKSAEVVNFEPSSSFKMPPMMTLDGPVEDSTPDKD